jgi:hypothetical protein
MVEKDITTTGEKPMKPTKLESIPESVQSPKNNPKPLIERFLQKHRLQLKTPETSAFSAFRVVGKGNRPKIVNMDRLKLINISPKKDSTTDSKQK